MADEQTCSAASSGDAKKSFCDDEPLDAPPVMRSTPARPAFEPVAAVQAHPAEGPRSERAHRLNAREPPVR
jgi:hypothetical protein